jgi:hypothetical protein
MITVYINYPQPHITVHRDLSCKQIRSHKKINQRCSRINSATEAEELQKFTRKEYSFAANPDENDIWLEIDYQNIDKELVILEMVCRAIARYYKPFRSKSPQIHC